jgi:hypothetical protein
MDFLTANDLITVAILSGYTDRVEHPGEVFCGAGDLVSSAINNQN